MRLRLTMLGTGSLADPYRAPLPTYAVVDVDYAGGRILVDVPDADVPPVLRAVLAARGTVRLSDAEAPPLTASHRRLWEAHLDSTYREHAGEFRPDLR